MQQLGLKSYRFSVGWSRVIPEEGKVNENGLRFYSDLIDALKAAGIEPLLTVYHWDMPLWVYKKGGWLSENPAFSRVHESACRCIFGPHFLVDADELSSVLYYERLYARGTRAV